MKKTISLLSSLYKKQIPGVYHDLKEEISDLTNLPFLESLESMLNSWPDKIQAHLPDVRDEASSVDVNATDARKLFANGMGLLFNEVQTISPLLSEKLEMIRRDLGLSALTIGRCLVYATPDGKGTAPHFDQNINFVLQIHGTKKWWIAPNNDVINPLTRHTMGMDPDPEMMSYLEKPLPESMPENAECIELKPGSLLFVPRGYWHSTEAHGDALALNFTFTAPTWVDLLTAALRGRLALSPEWRETAHPVDGKRFQELLQGLVHDLPNWKAEDILNATDPDHDQ